MAKKVTKKTTPKKATTRKKAAAKKTAGTNGLSAKAKAVAAKTASITEDQIRIRAFEIYTAGVNPSDPDADWLQAEQELQAEATR